jgi:hypothetical protein
MSSAGGLTTLARALGAIGPRVTLVSSRDGGARPLANLTPPPGSG